MKAKQKNAPKAVAAPAVVAVAPPKSLIKTLLSEPLALGLIPLILFRPWLDGITYPTDNFYFIWATILLFAIWLARVLVRNEPIRFGVPMLLLGGFWIVGLLTGIHTTQYDATDRTLIIWAGYFFLFAVAVNALRTPAAFAIVLGAFFASSLAETVWSLIHFKYVLAMVRETIVKNPHILKTYFGTETPSPELIHRLQVNRAFGSLLFPNALAAFLILGIPIALGFAIRSIREFSEKRKTWRAAGKQPGAENPMYVPVSPFAVLLSAGLVWLGSVALLGFLMSFINSTSTATSGFFATFFSGINSTPSMLVIIIVPVLLGLAVGWMLMRYGLAMFAMAVRVWVLPPLFVVQLAALWLTYSRGGVLALGAAVTAMACLAVVAWRGKTQGKRGLTSRVAAVLAFMTVAATLAATAQNQPVPPPAAVAPAPPMSSQPPAPPAQLAPAPAPAPIAAQPAPTPAPAPAPAQAAPTAPAQPTGSMSITEKGEYLSMQDLMNTASFKLRMSYWRTGLQMALDNLLLGVGLGNFGTVYPKYQLPGAGDVKTAHDDYLQILCETGIVGFLFFCAFWGYFVVWGAKRLFREQDPLERWVLGGLYAGVLAFLIHSMLDFNFYNPALAFFAFLISGVFYARASLNEPEAKEGRRRPLLALGLLMASVVVSAMALQVYMSDFIVSGGNWLNVGSNRNITSVFTAGEFFFRKIAAAQENKQMPVIDIVTAGKLISDRTALETCGPIHVPVAGSPSGHRELRADEPVPQNAFLVITRPQKARQTARTYADLWLEEIAHADAIYPHNPELASYFIEWYDMLSSAKLADEFKKKYTIEFVKWCERGIERSPEHFIFHQWYAKALWLRGNMETGPSRGDFFKKGLDEYKKAAELYPISVPTWRKYGEALTKYGNALVSSGDKPQGESYVDEGKKVFEHVKEIEQQNGDA